MPGTPNFAHLQSTSTAASLLTSPQFEVDSRHHFAYKRVIAYVPHFSRLFNHDPVTIGPRLVQHEHSQSYSGPKANWPESQKGRKAESQTAKKPGLPVISDRRSAISGSKLLWIALGTTPAELSKTHHRCSKETSPPPPCNKRSNFDFVWGFGVREGFEKLCAAS